MFDIGFLEILVIAVLGLLVLGPERLPEAIKTASLWMGRFKRAYRNVRAEVEKEIGADEIRQQLHNEEVMADLKKQEDALKKATESFPDADKTSSDNTPGSSS